MPWNGSGTYVLPPAYYPAVAGTTIESATHNSLMQDLATGISAALSRAGENVPTGNLPMGGFKHTGVANASGAGQYLAWGQNITVGEVSGSGNIVIYGDGLGVYAYNTGPTGGGSLTSIAGVNAGVRLGAGFGPIIFFAGNADRMTLSAAGVLTVPGGITGIASGRSASSAAVISGGNTPTEVVVEYLQLYSTVYFTMYLTANITSNTFVVDVNPSVPSAFTSDIDANGIATIQDSGVVGHVEADIIDDQIRAVFTTATIGNGQRIVLTGSYRIL